MTPRQQQVYDLLACRGMTTRQIADATEQTVIEAAGTIRDLKACGAVVKCGVLKSTRRNRTVAVWTRHVRSKPAVITPPPYAEGYANW